MMLDDQEYAGQSVAAQPGLCTPQTMAARVRLARAVGGEELKLLARTDILGADWPLDEVLRRLELYLEAGADWAMPVYLRSAGELERAAAVAPGRVIALAAPGASGYVPTLEEARAAGLRALLVVGQHRAVLPKLARSTSSACNSPTLASPARSRSSNLIRIGSPSTRKRCAISSTSRSGRGCGTAATSSMDSMLSQLYNYTVDNR